MKFKKLLNLIFILTSAFIAYACSDSSTASNEEVIIVNGRVASNETSNKSSSEAYSKPNAVEGATVTAARVAADGSLQTMKGAKTKTNTAGEFSLKINVEAIGDTPKKVIIVAQKAEKKWKAYVYGEIVSGSTIELSPLNAESSGEASVYQQVVANGENDLVTRADVEAFIGFQVATEVKSNTDAAAELAAGLASEARARSQFFANQSTEITDQQRTEINNAKAAALADLNAKLYASTSENAQAEAYNTFIREMADAYIEAGVQAGAHAKAKEMSSHLLIKNTTQLSSDARSEVRTNTARIVAIAIDNAIRARLEAASATESSIQAAMQAGTQLNSVFKAKTMASEDEIDDIFETYNAVIIDILQQEFSANAEVIANINGEINSTGGIKAALDAAIASNISTDVIVQAYSTFYTNVEAIVSDMFAEATETEAQLVTDLMILINIAG